VSRGASAFVGDRTDIFGPPCYAHGNAAQAFELRVNMGPPPRGGIPMAEYMAYSVGPDGYQIAFKALDCADDVEAAEKASQLVKDYDIEVWCGDRFVIRIDQKPK
jgi:hypothetical protein